MIHPTAIVEDGSIIGSNVSVGAYSYIGANVKLGDSVFVHAHAIIAGNTIIGNGTQIFPNAMIGMNPQDLKYKGEKNSITIGSNCIVRESVTIHPGTLSGNSTTSIGNNCLLMVGAHVAHDCNIGDNVILINQATLAGHSSVGDFAIIGGLSGIQPFVRIGKHAYIAGMTAVEMDILPYGIGKGILRRCFLTGVNIKGLKQRGFTKEDIQQIREVYTEIFDGPSIEIPDRARFLMKKYEGNNFIHDLLKFIIEKPDRRLCHPNEESIIK